MDPDELLARARQIAESVPGAMRAALDGLDGDPDAEQVRHRLEGPLDHHTQHVVSEPPSV